MFGGRQQRYNPDLLAARKGGLNIYRKMMVDEQVKAVMKFKRDAILGRGYEFVFCDTELPDTEQWDRKKVMLAMVERMGGSFTDALVAVLSGMIYGYSITERVTAPIQVNGKTYTGIARLLARPASTFTFYTDDYGTLTRFTQTAGTREVELDYSRFIHYVQNPEEDEYYGRSELEAAYRPWFLKDLAIRLGASYMERLAGGFVTINLGDSGIAAGSDEYVALQSILSNFHSSMGIMLPDGVTAEVTMPPSTDVFEKAEQRNDLAIAKALLIPNLLGLSHTGQTGAYSQSQTQLETFLMTLVTDISRLEQCLNDQLFRPLAQQNWDDGEFPRFRLKRMTEAQVKAVIDSWNTLTQNSAVIPTEKDESHIRELLQFPERTEQDLPIAKVKQDLVPIQLDPNKQQPVQPGAPQKGAAEPAANQQSAQMTATETALKFSVDAALTRVDFSVVAQKTMALEEEVAASVSKLAARSVREVISDERLAELLDQDTADIGQLEIDPVSIGRIKGAFKSGLERAWAMGITQAMTETSKARRTGFTETERKANFKALRESAADFFDSKAFKMAGDLTDGMRSMIQQELLAGVKAGRRPEVVAARIYDRLIRRGFLKLSDVLTEEPRENILALAQELLQDALGQANIPAYLNTLARTNTFEAMNEARYAEFTKPELSDFVVALQYSAILDDRTTEICRSLDQHVYAAKSDIWSTYRPPNHFNALSADSMVQTDRGSVRIADMVAGDMVLTHRGRYRPAYAVMRKTPDRDQLLAIKTDTGRILRATDDHPVLTSSGWRRASDLKVGDVLFERVENVTSMGDVPLVNPEYFPSLFDQPLIPYEIVSDTVSALMDLPIQLKRDLTIEREIENVSTDDMLELVGAESEQSHHHNLALGGLPSHGVGLSVDGRFHVGVPRVSSPHPGGRARALLSERPMLLTCAFCDYFRQSIGNTDLIRPASHIDAVNLAPPLQNGLPNTHVTLDLSERKPLVEVLGTDDALDDCALGKVGSFWRHATIISIADEPCTEKVWNIAVLDDESYVADGLIVHNCRSVLFAITAIDSWDGVESPAPTVQPQEGFK